MNKLPAHLANLTDEERDRFEADTLKAVVADTFSLLLEDLGVTQRELARRLKTSDANVSKLLSGAANLKLSTIAKIAFALGVRLVPALRPARTSGEGVERGTALPSWVATQEQTGELWLETWVTGFDPSSANLDESDWDDAGVGSADVIPIMPKIRRHGREWQSSVHLSCWLEGAEAQQTEPPGISYRPLFGMREADTRG